MIGDSDKITYIIPHYSESYPLHKRQYGCMKVYVDKKTHQTCYVPSGDLNIDSDIYRVEYHADGTVKKRHQIVNQETTKIKARFCQEIFKTSTNKSEVGRESVTTILTVEEVKEMIHSEPVNWKNYDVSLDKEQKQLDD